MVRGDPAAGADVPVSLPLYRPTDGRGIRSILYFHALARLGYHGLVLVEPEESFVSVGFFDDVNVVLDRDACRARGLPVMRREVGGGPVLLGPGQMFYNLILPWDWPGLPGGLEVGYRLLSGPAIETYKRFGVTALYRPINDLVTLEGRKISGQGAADIGGHLCFVGSIISHFDVETMAAVLRVQEEKFRDKVITSLSENMSWMERETGQCPEPDRVAEVLAESFAHLELIGGLQERPLPAEVMPLVRELETQLTSPEVLDAVTGRSHSSIKIREGVHLRAGTHKAPGGLIRAEVSTAEGSIIELVISGDFTMTPRDMLPKLCDALVAVPFDFRAVERRCQEFISREQVDLPGVTAADLARTIVGSSAR